MRPFAEADRMAAALGLDGLRHRLAAADAAIANAFWTGVGARLLLAVPLVAVMFALVRLTGWSWWLKALAGLAAYAAIAVPAVLMARRRRRPGAVEPVPDATAEALMDAVDRAFRALPERHRRRGHVLHARAGAAQAWAAGRGEPPEATAPGEPLTKPQRRAAEKLHRLVHRLAETTPEGPSREHALLDLARWDRALTLAGGRAHPTLIWTVLSGLVMAVVSTGWTNAIPAMVLMGAVTESVTTSCPVAAGLAGADVDRSPALREFAGAFPELAGLVRP